MKPGFKVTTKMVRDINPKAFEQLKQRFGAGNAIVKVGIPEGAKELDGTPTALVGAVQEYGSPERGIPERSFLRMGLREGRKQQIILNRRNLILIAKGQKTMLQALGELGQLAAGQVKRKIKAGPFEALAPATIKARFRRLSDGYKAQLAAKKKDGEPLTLDKPLIDTGQMWQSITYIVGALKK